MPCLIPIIFRSVIYLDTTNLCRICNLHLLNVFSSANLLAIGIKQLNSLSVRRKSYRFIFFKNIETIQRVTPHRLWRIKRHIPIHFSRFTSSKDNLDRLIFRNVFNGKRHASFFLIIRDSLFSYRLLIHCNRPNRVSCIRTNGNRSASIILHLLAFHSHSALSLLGSRYGIYHRGKCDFNNIVRIWIQFFRIWNILCIAIVLIFFFTVVYGNLANTIIFPRSCCNRNTFVRLNYHSPSIA